MGIVANKLQNIIKFDLNQATKQVVAHDKQTIIDLNKKQLDEGLKADGSEMPKYSARSLAIKQQKGIAVPRNQSFNLKLTGKLQSGIFVKAENTFFEISSTDSELDKKLTEQFPGKELEDEDAFGLSEDSKNEFIQDKLIPGYQSKLLR